MIILDAEGAQHRREGLILLQAFFADETKTSHAYAEQGQCGGSWDRRILHDVAVSIIGEMAYLETESKLLSSSSTTPATGRITTDKILFRNREVLQLKNVSYSYPNSKNNAVDSITYSFSRGKIYAIAGLPGSGKSTLMDLCLGLLEPSLGSISSLNENLVIGYVPQDVFLFSDTIANNIAFGLDQPNLDRITQAAKDADVYQNILDFPKGFDTLLGERGITLSGGQKQRVSIARAIVKEPKILILDDCLSAVDTKTENAILNSLQKIMKNRTSIIISHRVSSAKLADQIIVLDEGRIVERGDHGSLMEQKGVYAALFEKQTQGGESIEESGH